MITLELRVVFSITVMIEMFNTRVGIPNLFICANNANSIVLGSKHLIKTALFVRNCYSLCLKYKYEFYEGNVIFW